MGTKRRYAPEEIIRKLREADVLTSQGYTITEACKIIKINEQTYYRWCKEYGGRSKNTTRTVVGNTGHNLAIINNLVVSLSLMNGYKILPRLDAYLTLILPQP